MTSVRTAIILAGGLGTRLRTAVSDVPKPMARVAGRPFLEYQMDYWIAQGIEQFILSVGYLKHSIINHFGDRYRGCLVTYAVEDEPLGTGGGLLLAARDLKEPFLVLNGDTFFAVDLPNISHYHKDRDSEWTVALFRSNEAGRYMGIDVASNGRILSLQSHSSRPGSLANGGVYMVSPSAMALVKNRFEKKTSLEDELLPDIAAAGGAIFGLECTGRFIDIGIPEDYRRAAKVLLTESGV